MASRLRNVLSSQRLSGNRMYNTNRSPADSGLEPIWRSPPTFLAPCLRSSFSTSSPLSATLRRLKKRRPVNRDPYALRQAKARKEANLARQAVLRAQRAQQLGDPIRGVETEFVKSFDYETPQDPSQGKEASSLTLKAVASSPEAPPPSPAFTATETHLDHGISHSELESSLQFSRNLIRPLPLSASEDTDPEAAKKAEDNWTERDRFATEAVQRIVSLSNGNSLHRTKANIARIISTFGRHHTDKTLKPKAPPAAAAVQDPPLLEAGATPRAGPDTGSSEVQIGILTAKIRVLADRYEGENRNDKINKRNLRLLLHRRQKLLSYMEKKERGSERWQHMLERLGLTEATWKGQIAVQ